ncbi:hypothetical protein SLA2020_420220 [Shorea laevis]
MKWQSRTFRFVIFGHRHSSGVRHSLEIDRFLWSSGPLFREESWKLLNFLQHFQPQPWLCIGDFNEIVDHSEKRGGAMRSERQMESFREA